MKAVILIEIWLLYFLISIPCYSQFTGVSSKRFTVVTRIIDGDTFCINDNIGNELKIRLIGIDAPETRRTRAKEVGYYAEEAKRYLTELILNKKVRMEFDVDTFDQYHRTLAYVFLENETFLNEKLVKEGYAMVSTVPPNVKYAEKFVKLAREAREKKRGLWASQ